MSEDVHKARPFRAGVPGAMSPGPERPGFALVAGSSRDPILRIERGLKTVLKALPPDCLLEGRLNPTIADRLRRVREIAMTSVANLRGVERDERGAFLVWDFVEGVSFDTVAADPEQSSDKVIDLIRELIHTVEHFHATGLVHGALHGGNVLVDSAGRIRLIDVSPLLHLDPKRDERAVVEMCRSIVNARKDVDSTLGAAVIAASWHESPMQELSARLSRVESHGSTGPSESRVRIRRRTLLAALLVLAIGAGAAVAISFAVQRNQPSPLAPTRLLK